MSDVIQSAQKSAQIQYPFYQQTPYYQWPTAIAPSEDYANEVDVAENDHDAVLTFYRRRGTGRSHVRTITVPKGLLPLIAAPKKGSKR